MMDRPDDRRPAVRRAPRPPYGEAMLTATVTVPATSANLGPGFDALGLALKLTDSVTARISDGFRVTVKGEGAEQVPAGPDHLIVATMLTTYGELGEPAPAGLAVRCRNQIPHARGLGSSSAAIVAGILLARALAERPDFDDAAVLRLAARLEGHPDNVAPCLLGGLTIAWTDDDGARAVRLKTPRNLRLGVFIPQRQGLTAHARAALPPSVPHADAAFNAARSALLVHALTAAPERLWVATEDRLHQGYRAESMPETAALLASLRAAGVAAVVSGAGPSILALTDATGVPVPAGWCFRSLSIASTGARILGSRHAGGDPVAAGPPS
jgi:homoserine kinase